MRIKESPSRDGAAVGDRALQLLEQGLSRAEIAERLGLRPHNVGGMIFRARQRRDKAKETGE